MNSIAEIEASTGILLPVEYKNFVHSVANYTERYFKDDDEDDDFPGRPWFLWSIDRLSEVLEMKGVGSEPMFRALSLYTKVFSEFTSEDTTYSPDGDIPIERVARGFVIGKENGDYLYLDSSDNFSVWIYYHDGGDVKRISVSFEAWLNESNPA